MAKYPVSESSFREIIRGGYKYVDKTRYIHRLADTGKFYFLSRPRRFGKSLLISTMECYFRNERDLFTGLDIDRLESGEWTAHPVLHLDFTRGNYDTTDGLAEALCAFLDKWEKEYGAPDPKRESLALRFDGLIRHIYDTTGSQAVVLIDECDSPIVDVHDDPALEAANRRTLHDFFRVMKADTDCLKFVFLTGVGKLGAADIFSGLNNIKDISLSPDYTAICGITADELTGNFREGIETLAREIGVSYHEALRRLKENYDGYHFSKDMTDIYNPYSIINALNDRHIGDYWFTSGTPTRLIRLFMENDWGSPDLEGTVVSRSMLDTGDVLGDNMPLTCYYTGYLTIKGYDADEDEYTLGYPNAEVRNSFFNNLLKSVRHCDTMYADSFVRSLKRHIRHDDIDGFLHELQSFLAGVPYLPHTDKEPQWQKDILIIARLVGIDADAERRTSRGRMDMVLSGANAIYILEFKYGGTPEEALSQINEKEYALPFDNSLNSKKIVKVGVNISPKTRNIDGWIIEQGA